MIKLAQSFKAFYQPKNEKNRVRYCYYLDDLLRRSFRFEIIPPLPLLLPPLQLPLLLSLLP